MQITLAIIMIGAADQMRVSKLEAECTDLAVLVDVPGAGVRLATPDVLDSTFNRLMYLDGDTNGSSTKSMMKQVLAVNA